MITQPTKLKVLLFISGCFLAQAGFTQESDPLAGESENAGQSENASDETEFNDDNYRRFMELRSGGNMRNVLPESAFETGSALEKIQSLPEESQKHLRNELRDRIVEGEKWTPEQLEADYPYSPSEAAQSDDGLKEQESEAWDELVSEYHAREADIFAHSARSQMASASSAAGNAAGSPATGSGQQGDGGGAESTGSNNTETSAREAAMQAARNAPESDQSVDNPSDQPDTRGVSQNALEFLIASGDAAPNRGPEQGEADAEANENPTAQDEAESIIVPGTLSIEELSNAQGVVVPEESEDDEEIDGSK